MGSPAVAFDAPQVTDFASKPTPRPFPLPLAGEGSGGDNAELHDFRLRALMPAPDWDSLPIAIRRRFSKRLAHGQSIVYAGEILESWMSRAGWCLAQAVRLIGSPLPLTRTPAQANAHVPGVVSVTGGMGGQIWTRLYARRSGFPQVIHSSKRFAGPTGLEEYVGFGIGMALKVYARDSALVFRSQNYFVQLFGRRFALPAWLTPGTLYVTHADLPDGKFSFTLQIFHPRLGLILRQMAIFRDATP